MKIISTLAVVLALSVSATLGQDLPKGSYVAQPSGDASSIRLLVIWGSESSSNTCQLMVDFKGSEVTEMRYNGCVSSIDTNKVMYQYPSDIVNDSFVSLKDWKAFALKVRQDFAFVGEDSYVELAPYTLVGKSTVLDHFEMPEFCETLIFKKGERMLAIRLDQWKGPVPTMGTSVRIGQTADSSYFFPVRLIDHEWHLSDEMTAQLKTDAEEATKFARDNHLPTADRIK